LRAAFESMVRADPDWDGEVLELVVVEMAEQTVAIRGTASAQAPAVWGLRCRVRESVVAFLQELDGGRYLPRTRVELPEREGLVADGSKLPLAAADAT
jgi:hypothetical protein